MQNWIGGGRTPRLARYVPLPPGLVPGLMDDLFAFLHRDDLHPVAQAAIAHAQFESIHPFTDGNGRIGRALMARPRLLLLDEPSMGLAPMLVRQIFKIVSEINAQGTTILLVEQNAAQALRVADRAYVLQTGRVIRDDSADNLLGDEAVQKAYLGGDIE